LLCRALQIGEVTLKVHKRPQKAAADVKAEPEGSSNGKHEQGSSNGKHEPAAAAGFVDGDDKRSSKRRDSSRSRSADRDGKRRSGRDREKVIYTSRAPTAIGFIVYFL
jgi:hypothetical protein